MNNLFWDELAKRSTAKVKHAITRQMSKPLARSTDFTLFLISLIFKEYHCIVFQRKDFGAFDNSELSNEPI